MASLEAKASEGGLSAAEAAKLLAEVGPNALVEHRTPMALKFLAFFWGPIPWMIEAAMGLSLVVRDWADAAIIGVMLLMNAVIGFWQEFKADHALEMLKKKLALSARVKRNGQWVTRPAEELVPGDVVRVRLGDRVPADVKLIATAGLSVDQSALTGESLPVEVNNGGETFAGTIVRQGEAEAVVTQTGMRTRFGKTAALVEKAHTVSHYQKAVLRIGHFLILLTAALVVLILLVALYRDTPMLETLQFCLILTVAAIPVALPAVLSVTMAVGAMRLSKQQAIVSRLVSIEEMAGMDVLCSDKTGTLTKNELAVGEPVVFGDADAWQVIELAALASEAESTDAIDTAIIAKRGAPVSGYTVEKFEPFDPVTKRTVATVSRGGATFSVAKGAVQAIVSMCDGAPAGEVNAATEAMAGRGERALAVASTDAAGKWRMRGLLPLSDPPREDSAKTIATARELGVEVKMVTGDHLAIARQIADKLGLGSNISAAGTIFEDHDPSLDQRVEQADGFAEVFPEHKFAIVETLERLGHFVGMTGDGVNDAPALKKADVGVAVDGATDAARQAADLVLTAPGLSVIVDAITESRRIFRRMTSYAIYRIAETIRVLLFMTLAILVFDFYPVTTVMIVLLALLNDGPILMIAYDRAIAPDRPVRWDMHRVLTVATTLGLLGVVSSFVMFWLGENYLHLARPTVQTLMFLKLTVAGHMTIYLARTADEHFWQRPFPGLALLGASESTQLVATVFAAQGWLMPAIGWKLAGFVWVYAIGWFLVNDMVKVQVYRLIAGRGLTERQHQTRMTERAG
ncbi:MAG: plasma-membrane proton-efflux P-type ATPase [Planctomycetes bacterium]|nr:plasma-membrane proton-efflux P-type ATPase [Planctomycetota bacterium]